MGYDLERFTSDIDEELKCPICCGVLEDPLQGYKCEHVFCRKCIAEWMKTSQSCPVDRQPMQVNQLQPIPRIVRNLLNHLTIRCEFMAAGCKEVVRLEDLGTHKMSCEFNPEFPVPCSRRCGALVPKNQLDNHDCIRDLRQMIITQQREIGDLRNTLNQVSCLSEEQKQMASNNCSSLMDLSERYEHLKLSISNLENPIKQILALAMRRDDNQSFEWSTEVKNMLSAETTIEIYISNVDRAVTCQNLKEYLISNEINVISCKEAVCRGWKTDFRVKIFKSEANKLLQARLWPTGITCFVCGDYYNTKVDGTRRDNDETDGSEHTLKASIPPWMVS